MKSLERTLWEATDKLRKNLDANDYKYIVLGLIFLKFVSASKWSYLKDCAKACDPGITKTIADTMKELEKNNPTLSGKRR